MTRKEFLLTAGGGMAGLLAALGLARCSSNPAGPSGTTSRSFTSTSANGHTHAVTIARTDVESPPAAGISKTTSSSSGHTHSFDMTQAQLQTVMGGGSVVITSGSSSVGGAHTHDFTITKWF